MLSYKERSLPITVLSASESVAISRILTLPEGEGFSPNGSQGSFGVGRPRAIPRSNWLRAELWNWLQADVCATLEGMGDRERSKEPPHRIEPRSALGCKLPSRGGIPAQPAQEYTEK